VNTSIAGVAAPVWLRMTRVGDTITSYYRKDRMAAWTMIGAQTLTALPATVDVGLAVTSHADPTVATAKFAGVWVGRLQTWTNTTIGSVSGGFTTDQTTYTVKGSGADIWGTSDAFNYMWVGRSFSGTITVRVQSVDNTHAWAKAGLMIRESLAPDAKQVDAFVTPGKGIAMQYRSTTGGASASVANVAGAAAVWLRLQRQIGASGATDGCIAWYSTDGQIWRVLGSVNFNMTHAAPVYIGVAVTSHNTGAIAASVIDSVRVEP
jgi:hypothetical protein